MLIQLVFQIVIMFAAAIVASMVYLSAVIMKSGSAGIPPYLYAYIIENLALNSLFMVVLQIVFAHAACKAAFRHISNHIVISIDILYFESLLLTLFCHTMKTYRNPLTESMI